MDNGRLSAELEQLERTLAAGPRLEPSAALRQRVLREVQVELQRDMRVELQRDDVVPRWQFATAAAAAVFLWVGLSLTAARVAQSAMQPRGTDPEVGAIAKQIQELSPDFLPEESLREARLLQIAGEVSSRPLLGERLLIGGVERRDRAQQEEPRERNDSKRASPPSDQPGIDPQGAGVLKAIENDYA